MKKSVYTLLLSLAAAVLLVGCLKDMKDPELFGGTKRVDIGIELPAALASESLAGFRVKLGNTKTGTSYLTETDETGRAGFAAEYGNYSVIVSKQIEVDGVVKMLTATQDLILSRDDQPVQSVTLGIKASNKGTIILKETYFHKTMTPDGKSKYNLDQYFSLYNNSDKVQYLDGIALGFHTDLNSGKAANFVKEWIEGSTELRDSVPINAMGLMFPGDGTRWPLQPGKEVVIALSAINHTADVTRNPMNLTGDNVWAMWLDRFTSSKSQQAPQAGVKRLETFCELAKGSAIVLSAISPAIVIYRIEGDAREYVAEGAVAGRKYGNVMFKPSKYTSLPSIMIPKEWVYDAVEFRSNPTHVPRLNSEVSLEPLSITTKSNSGISYVRKIDEEATAASGRTVYRDTNNSAEDWMMIDRPMLSTK